MARNKKEVRPKSFPEQLIDNYTKIIRELNLGLTDFVVTVKRIHPEMEWYDVLIGINRSEDGYQYHIKRGTNFTCYHDRSGKGGALYNTDNIKHDLTVCLRDLGYDR